MNNDPSVSLDSLLRDLSANLLGDLILARHINYGALTKQGLRMLFPGTVPNQTLWEWMSEGYEFDPQRATIADDLRLVAEVLDWDPNGDKILGIVSNSSLSKAVAKELRKQKPADRILSLLLRHIAIEGEKPIPEKRGFFGANEVRSDPWIAIRNRMMEYRLPPDDDRNIWIKIKKPDDPACWDDELGQPKSAADSILKPAFEKFNSAVCSELSDAGSPPKMWFNGYGVVGGSTRLVLPNSKQINTIYHSIDEGVAFIRFTTERPWSGRLKQRLAETWMEALFPGSCIMPPPKGHLSRGWTPPQRPFLSFNLRPFLNPSTWTTGGEKRRKVSQQLALVPQSIVLDVVGRPGLHISLSSQNNDYALPDQIERLVLSYKLAAESLDPVRCEIVLYQDGKEAGRLFLTKSNINLSGVPKKHHIGVLKRLAEWGVSIERKMDWCALADALLAPDGAPAVSGTEVDKELLNVGVFVPTNLSDVVECPCGCGLTASVKHGLATCPVSGTAYQVGNTDLAQYKFSEKGLASYVGMLVGSSEPKPLRYGCWDLGKRGRAHLYLAVRRDERVFDCIDAAKPLIIWGCSRYERRSDIVNVSVVDLVVASKVPSKRTINTLLAYSRLQREQTPKRMELKEREKWIESGFVNHLVKIREKEQTLSVPDIKHELFPRVERGMALFRPTSGPFAKLSSRNQDMRRRRKGAVPEVNQIISDERTERRKSNAYLALLAQVRQMVGDEVWTIRDASRKNRNAILEKLERGSFAYAWACAALGFAEAFSFCTEERLAEARFLDKRLNPQSPSRKKRRTTVITGSRWTDAAPSPGRPGEKGGEFVDRNDILSYLESRLRFYRENTGPQAFTVLSCIEEALRDMHDKYPLNDMTKT